MACRSLDTTTRGVDVAHGLELTSPRSRAPYAGRTRRLSFVGCEAWVGGFC